MSTSDSILIAGGGIAGLAVALALSRRGLPSRVLEQAKGFEEVGAGLQLGPNAMRALEALGVLDAVAPKLVAPRAVEIRDGVSGKLLTAVPLGEAIETRFGAAYHVVHRADLLAGLLAKARTEPSITLETGMRLESFRQDAAGIAAIVKGQEIAAPALIGADGLRSTIREAVLRDGPPVYANHTLYRALVPRAKAPAAAAQDLVCLWLCPGGHVVHYPVSGGAKVNIVAAFDNHWHEPGWGSHGSKRALHTAFGRVTAPLHEVLDCTDRWLKWAAMDRPPASQWGTGRVTLVGDAAHPVLPYLAQGAAMAIEDAVVLGRSLVGHGDLTTAFRAYEAERQPRVAQMQQHCRRLGRAYHARGALRIARNLVLGLMTPDRSYGQMKWIYDWH
ncbi:salicylate hydroxylase [Rhodoligotrophos appendicifer]|uniref:FAD-dependent monooxygenase n=1 Tax=Rhodoligotrophos appendicifer TaxID=987056 RepID=UPI0011855095|nr:FAD-dependent monooxygenase [Rhodoligotrophos appendicifer]